MDENARRRWKKVSIKASRVCVGLGSDSCRVRTESIAEVGNVNIGKLTECASGNEGRNPCTSMCTVENVSRTNDTDGDLPNSPFDSAVV
jgi:hypothetical protein